MQKERGKRTIASKIIWNRKKKIDRSNEIRRFMTLANHFCQVCWKFIQVKEGRFALSAVYSPNLILILIFFC